MAPGLLRKRRLIGSVKADWRCRLALRIAISGAIWAVPGFGAFAQAPGATPLVPLGSPIPRILPPTLPPVSPGPAVPALPPPATAMPNAAVRVTHVLVEGAIAYPAAKITPGDLSGPAIPLARIEAARQAILERYRADGFVLTVVSASVDADGTLRFLITEGHIESVKLAGDIGPAGTQVLRFLERLTEVRPIDAATLERYLLLAQDVPGITLHAVLQPSQQPGALTLIAQVSRKPLSGLATVDNRASPYTGPIEAIGVLDLNSFTQFGERTELSLYHAFPNTQTFGQVSNEFYIGASGLRLRVYAGSGPSNPTGPLALEGYQGVTDVAGLTFTYPVIRARQQTLNVSGSLDALQSAIDTTATGIRTRTSYDSLRVLRAGSDYVRSDLVFGAEHPASNSVVVRLSKGLPILGASPDGEADAPRVGEQTNFFKFDAEVSRTQTLVTPWQNASVALMGLLTGQVSPDVLPPAEKFYLGGLRLTQGYYAGQVSGDNALAASVELQLNTGLDFTRFGFAEDVSAQFFAFYDWGETWENRSSDPNEHLSSVGGGVRLAVTKYTELDLTALTRFNRFPNGSGPDISALPGSAFYWRILVRY